MSDVKERIIGAITVMSEENARKIWALIEKNFENGLWAKIDEVTPDEWDLKMLDEISNNSDCKSFMTADEVYKELEIQ